MGISNGTIDVSDIRKSSRLSHPRWETRCPSGEHSYVTHHIIYQSLSLIQKRIKATVTHQSWPSNNASWTTINQIYCGFHYLDNSDWWVTLIFVTFLPLWFQLCEGSDLVSIVVIILRLETWRKVSIHPPSATYLLDPRIFRLPLKSASLLASSHWL